MIVVQLKAGTSGHDPTGIRFGAGTSRQASRYQRKSDIAPNLRDRYKQ